MVFKKVALLLAAILQVHPDDIKQGDILSREYGIEPLDVARLVIECEKKFKITVLDEDVPQWRTVQDVVDYITAALDDR